MGTLIKPRSRLHAMWLSLFYERDLLAEVILGEECLFSYPPPTKEN